VSVCVRLLRLRDSCHFFFFVVVGDRQSVIVIVIDIVVIPFRRLFSKRARSLLLFLFRPIVSEPHKTLMVAVKNKEEEQHWQWQWQWRVVVFCGLWLCCRSGLRSIIVLVVVVLLVDDKAPDNQALAHSSCSRTHATLGLMGGKQTLTTSLSFFNAGCVGFAPRVNKSYMCEYIDDAQSSNERERMYRGGLWGSLFLLSLL